MPPRSADRLGVAPSAEAIGDRQLAQILPIRFIAILFVCVLIN
jgi:hypothetical protein